MSDISTKHRYTLSLALGLCMLGGVTFFGQSLRANDLVKKYVYPHTLFRSPQQILEDLSFFLTSETFTWNKDQIKALTTIREHMEKFIYPTARSNDYIPGVQGNPYIEVRSCEAEASIMSALVEATLEQNKIWHKERNFEPSLGLQDAHIIEVCSALFFYALTAQDGQYRKTLIAKDAIVILQHILKWNMPSHEVEHFQAQLDFFNSILKQEKTLETLRELQLQEEMP